VALLGIWWHIGRRTRDTGQVFLAVSVALWAVSGVVEVLYAGTLESALTEASIDVSTTAYARMVGWRSVLSLANSLFILLALPWFRYLPTRLAPVVNSGYWPLIVGLPCVLALLPTLRQLFVGEPSTLAAELDVYYALLTLAVLGVVLWTSFARRRLPTLAYLTALCIGVTVGAQVLKLAADPGAQIVLAAAFKTCLIMLFFALALSWVRELTETAQPVLAKAVRLHLLPHRTVSLEGLRNVDTYSSEQLITLTPANFELLKRFAERRKNDPQGGWLEIKPKHDSRSRKVYDIRDHNELRRLAHALLDGLYGAGNWARDQHELPLKTALFETDDARPRTIRLALPPEAISLVDTEVASR